MWMRTCTIQIRNYEKHNFLHNDEIFNYKKKRYYALWFVLINCCTYVKGNSQ